MAVAVDAARAAKAVAGRDRGQGGSTASASCASRCGNSALRIIASLEEQFVERVSEFEAIASKMRITLREIRSLPLALAELGRAAVDQNDHDYARALYGAAERMRGVRLPEVEPSDAEILHTMARLTGMIRSAASPVSSTMSLQPILLSIRPRRRIGTRCSPPPLAANQATNKINRAGPVTDQLRRAPPNTPQSRRSAKVAMQRYAILEVIGDARRPDHAVLIVSRCVRASGSRTARGSASQCLTDFLAIGRPMGAASVLSRTKAQAGGVRQGGRRRSGRVGSRRGLELGNFRRARRCCPLPTGFEVFLASASAAEWAEAKARLGLFVVRENGLSGIIWLKALPDRDQAAAILDVLGIKSAWRGPAPKMAARGGYSPLARMAR